MEKVAKRLFADLRRLESRVKRIEKLLSLDDVLTAPRRALVVEQEESNNQGEGWAGTNAAQAQASP